MSTTRNLLLVAVFAISLIAAVHFVFAAHVIRTSAGGTSFSINEDTFDVLNISVNHTDPTGIANITRVNITLPSGFTFVTGSNLTTAGAHAFSNTSTVLSWTNNTFVLIVNLTTRYFSFNTSAATPGTYNLSITTLNITGAYQTNLTVTVNDTTVPSSVEFADPTNASGTNLSTTSITANITFADNGVLSTAIIHLYNSTGLMNTSNASTSSLSFTFLNLSDGHYQINATVNDSFNNQNASVTRTITVDTTAPSAGASCEEESVDRDEELTCTCSASDATSGVASTEYTENPDTSETGTFTTTCTVTDHSGNSASSEFEYTVESSRQFGSSGGGSTTTTTTPTWSATLRNDDADLSTKGDVRSRLAARQRLQLNVGGETHHVGIKSLTATSAVIEIASTPQEATFTTGESKKFDVDADNYYDMEVTLESIEASKAAVVIRAIHEEVPGTSTTTTTENTTTTGESESAEGSSMTWLWIILTVAVVAVVAYFVMRPKKHY